MLCVTQFQASTSPCPVPLSKLKPFGFGSLVPFPFVGHFKGGRENTLSPKPCMLDKSQMHPPIIQHVGKGETGLHGPINRPLSSAAAVVVKIICRWMVGNFPPSPMCWKHQQLAAHRQFFALPHVGNVTIAKHMPGNSDKFY